MIIDFHAHIMPGLDHGCDDLPTSLQQLQMAKKAGIDIIIATSHFYPHKENVDKFLLRREKSWDILRQSLTEDMPEIILGAETLICSGMQRIDGLKELSFQGTILLEMPSTKWNTDIFHTVEKINEIFDGRAIIAHVDRYNTSEVEKLYQLDVHGQLNASSLCMFTRRKKLMKWVENHNIVALGSDIHGVSEGYKKFLKAKILLGEHFKYIMKDSEKLLLATSKF